MSATYLDHIYAFVVFLAFPIYARISFPAVVEEVRTGGEKARINVYQRTIATWFLFAVLMLLLWSLDDRSWIELGITTGQPGKQIIAALIATAVVVAFTLPLRNLVKSGNIEESLSGFADVFVLMPANVREVRWFRFVSVNAGVSEELIFRGYLLWYLGNYVTVWQAAIIATIAFGFAHLYQGLKQAPGIIVVAAIAVGLYIYTESLLVPVFYHALHDAVQGHYLARLRRRLEADAVKQVDQVL